MGSCVEGAIPLAVVGLNRRTNSFVMCGSSALGHGGTSATAMRCWHFAAPSITGPSLGYLNAIDSDFERRKNHRMLLLPGRFSRLSSQQKTVFLWPEDPSDGHPRGTACRMFLDPWRLWRCGCLAVLCL